MAARWWRHDRLRAKLAETPILVIRPGVQANGHESAQRRLEDGATQVCFTLEDAHIGAAQRLVMNDIDEEKAVRAPVR
jgi:hypothetical protein